MSDEVHVTPPTVRDERMEWWRAVGIYEHPSGGRYAIASQAFETEREARELLARRLAQNAVDGWIEGSRWEPVDA